MRHEGVDPGPYQLLAPFALADIDAGHGAGVAENAVRAGQADADRVGQAVLFLDHEGGNFLLGALVRRRKAQLLNRHATDDVAQHVVGIHHGPGDPFGQQAGHIAELITSLRFVAPIGCVKVVAGCRYQRHAKCGAADQAFLVFIHGTETAAACADRPVNWRSAARRLCPRNASCCQGPQCPASAERRPGCFPSRRCARPAWPANM